MIKAVGFEGQKIALFGLGGSGLATAKSLQEGGANVIVWDDNPASVEKAQIEGLTALDLRNEDWSKFNTLVLSPGVPLTHPKPHWCAELANEHNVPIIGDVEIFARTRAALAPHEPFIAITGTNGKSTTTALIAHILQENERDTQMGGNIGRAVLTLDPPCKGRVYVVECSSYQIDLAPSLRPTAGILLNLSPDHLDRHGSFDHYSAVKKQLVAGSQCAVIGVDDPHCRIIANELIDEGHKVVRIATNLDEGADYSSEGTIVFELKEGVRTPIASLPQNNALRGIHNVQNCLAAFGALRAIGLRIDEIIAGLKSFDGLAHRMEPIGFRGKCCFVNDSKATNAQAAAKALASYDNIFWIAGGLPKEGGIASLAPLFSRISKAYLIGEAAAQFAATLGDQVPFEICDSLDIAVQHAARDGALYDGSEATVLLSPACASFDLYPNFEVRGEAFRQAVASLDAQVFKG